MWDCTGASNQRWTVAGDGSGRALGACLDVTSGPTANGADLDLHRSRRPEVAAPVRRAPMRRAPVRRP
ncbi:hypothetical protein [Streptomyces finlayi]|uniref:hypothetical protein n=1 Tax=Streptomyces finlayi TaxID=67296 RepID=UPI0035BC0E57